MKHSSKFLFVSLLGVLAGACELAVDFDRSKIPTESLDASVVTPIVTTDSGNVVPGMDAGDAGADASVKADAAAPSLDAAPTMTDAASATADATTNAG